MIDSETLLSVRSKISSARLIRSFHPHSAHLNGIKVWLNPTDLTIWFFIFLALCSRGFVWVTRSGAWNCYAGMCSSGLKNLQWLWLPHCLEMSFLCFWLPLIPFRIPGFPFEALLIPVKLMTRSWNANANLKLRQLWPKRSRMAQRLSQRKTQLCFLAEEWESARHLECNTWHRWICMYICI